MSGLKMKTVRFFETLAFTHTQHGIAIQKKNNDIINFKTLCVKNPEYQRHYEKNLSLDWTQKEFKQLLTFITDFTKTHFSFTLTFGFQLRFFH
jgi:hypothetical protein